MKMRDMHDKVVSVDIRESTYPIRILSKSKLQKIVGEYLQQNYPRAGTLEEFSIPGSRMHCDYFIPSYGLVIEINGIQHYEKNSFFHKEQGAFAKQVNRDIVKQLWAEKNGFIFIEIITEKDLEKIDNAINDS